MPRNCKNQCQAKTKNGKGPVCQNCIGQGETCCWRHKTTCTQTHVKEQKEQKEQKQIFLPEKKQQQRVESIERKNFFEDVIGMKEELWRSNEKYIKKSILRGHHKDDKKIFYLKNTTNKQMFQAGNHMEYTLAELRAQTNSLIIQGGGTFNVRDGGAKKFVDFGCLQSYPKNRDAIFQVASNFNALEATESDENIQTQLLTNYIHDPTQGAAASISAAPGLILRKYYYYWSASKNSEIWKWEQTPTHHINLLDNIPELTISKGGYVSFNRVVTKKISPSETDLKRMKILFHHSIQITHGCMINEAKHYKLNDSKQIINQVFVAAADWSETNKKYVNNEIANDWAYYLLQAAYEGTLRIAALKGKKKVFLTLVGVENFGNPISWIIEILSNLKDFIKDSGLEVNLIASQKLKLPAKDKKRLDNLVNETGGKYE